MQAESNTPMQQKEKEFYKVFPSKSQINLPLIEKLDSDKVYKEGKEENFKSTFILNYEEKSNNLLENANQCDSITVINWVSNSGKSSNLGYLLSNGSLCANFNDGSKMILNASNILYIYKDGKSREYTNELYNLDHYPSELNAKLKQINYYKVFFNMNVNCLDNSKTKMLETQKSEIIFVKKWFLSKNIIVFILNNNCIQFIFEDNSEILLKNSMNEAIFKNSNGEKVVSTFSSENEIANIEFKEKLEVAKKILSLMSAAKLKSTSIC